MINTYWYGGKVKTVKDGKEIEINIPSAIVLNRMGAFVDVIITHPRIVQEKLRAEGNQIPSYKTRALIDTGASNTVISPTVADKLNLVHTGYQKVASVHDEKDRPVYYGFVTFPWGNGKEIPIICCEIKNFPCLIGRDILQHWHFNYNGPDGSIVICD